MERKIPLDLPPPRPCVGSGFCCKKAPCPYGARDPSSGWCIHLEPWKGDDLGVERYRCGRYEYIRQQPGNEYVPAFGAGCCAPLFNDDRDRIVQALLLRRSRGEGVPGDGSADLDPTRELPGFGGLLEVLRRR